LLEIINKVEGNIISSLCGATGICGKCRILVHSQDSQGLNKPTKIEKLLLGEQLNQNIRLACQVIPISDLRIEIIDIGEYKDSLFKIQDSYKNFRLNFPFYPRLCSQTIPLHKPTLENAQDDYTRLLLALEESFSKPIRPVNLEILHQLGNQLRTPNENISVIIDRQESQLVRFDTKEIPLLGAIVDIGTTSIVATLIDLNSGNILGADSIINPQIEFGRDIMSRLTYALQSPSKQQQIQERVLKGVSKLIKKVTKSVKQRAADIHELIAVGNSVMHHLFLNLPVTGLSRAPFVPVISNTISFFVKDFDAKNILGLSPYSIITMPPLVGGFIGSDAVADILYTEFYKKEGIHLLIDFGTNSEIILRTSEDNGLYAASVAAGGAFEGQHIACGMRGISGAIERFEIINNDYKFDTIQATKPKGICGTGIIDILAQLRYNNRMDKRGRIFDNNGEITKIITLVPKEQTSTGKPIYITRLDVEAIQKAKAATLAAIRSLTTKLNISLDDIETIQIAGVFGSNLNIKNAISIGLLPNLPSNQFIAQGNTAEKGGRTLLLSTEARIIGESIAKNVKRLELSTIPNFQSYFTEELFFP
jgi:uncharacterized 2Fe-2S/4Fe-4S cluster protein (DUF4445 family)